MTIGVFHLGDHGRRVLSAAICEHHRLRITCPECKRRPHDDLVASMGPVVPHALAAQAAANVLRRERLPGVEGQGQKGDLPPIDAMNLKSTEYEHAIERRHPGGSSRSREWGWIRGKVLERDGRACCVCGDPHGVDVDHILPLAQGGANSWRNLWTLCNACGRAKRGGSLRSTRITGASGGG